MTTLSSPSRGILLIALGAPEYGDMAANLAASIRYADTDIAIHLVHTERSTAHLTDAHRALFSSSAECPVEYYTRQTPAPNPPKGALIQNTVESEMAVKAPFGGLGADLEYIKAKTHLYELTPFEETLFLDVDMYILPTTRMSEVMTELSSVCHYTIENRGYADLSLPDAKLDPLYSTWVNILDVKKHYQTTGRFYHLHSEFVFFKKNEKNKRFFETVREVYDRRPVPWTVFDGAVPDEYAFDIATCITGHYPHQDGYIAIYWHGMDGRKDWNKDVVKNYIGFSLGGNYIPDWITGKVNAYKQLFRKALKLPHLFHVAPKRRWNVKRRTM
jgi:hypothetical protein